MLNHEICRTGRNRCLFSVDGGWSNWSQWTDCSVTCGDGTITRFRQCDNPQPASGGVTCTGDATESSDCNEASCPGK